MWPSVAAFRKMFHVNDDDYELPRSCAISQGHKVRCRHTILDTSTDPNHLANTLLLFLILFIGVTHNEICWCHHFNFHSIFQLQCVWSAFLRRWGEKLGAKCSRQNESDTIAITCAFPLSLSFSLILSNWNWSVSRSRDHLNRLYNIYICVVVPCDFNSNALTLCVAAQCTLYVRWQHVSPYPIKNWMSHTIEILIILQYETHQNTICKWSSII